jgi:tetratricopeptide (TPR) repeat protein
MAENWTTAFGRYLRTLRERRGLSLHDVSALSQPFADTLNKGYLSRCENGRQRLAFSKVIPLSRIYNVPADVLLERMELDMELDRVGGPDTAGMSFSDLTKAGTEALIQGYRWKGYAYLRDALPRAGVGDLMAGFRDTEEQVLCSFMNCGTSALGLGRLRFCLHEYLFIRASGVLGPRFRPVLLERLSVTHRGLKQPEQARQFAEEAVREGEAFGELSYLGFIYFNRAKQAHEEGDHELAITFYQKAYETHRAAERPPESACALHNLAQVYFDLKRYRTARRTLIAAQRLMKPLQQHRTLALNWMLMGELDALEKQDERAAIHWREAVEMAKKLNDKVLRFKAEYLLFRQACEKGNEPAARSIERRLRKLSNWVPESTPELREFAELSAKFIA